MPANYNQVLSAGKADGYTKNITTAKTSVAEVGAPADAADFREVFVADADNGGCVQEIGYQVIGTGTQAAGLVYIWKTDAAGANARIVDYFTISAGAAMSTTVPGQRDVKTPSFENLPPGTKLYMSATVVSANCSFNAWAKGGQFKSY
jgi:hypothetical protein